MVKVLETRVCKCTLLSILGKRGQVSLLYRDCVNRAKAELDDMDEAQRLVDEQSVRKEGSVKRSWSRASVDDAPAEESSPAPVDL